ncbi:TPA: RNase J family beta-CASP ribonuclease, partial [Enterococcus faecium]|nr:RNase J family beta-CASP ribonuclease [Enterococcus faecium]
EYKNKRMSVAGTTSAENVMIDGLGIGDIGNIVLRDRKILSEDGIFVAVVTISRREKKIISKPQITSRGFVYVKASRDLMKESSNMIETIVEKHLESNDFEWSKLKQDIRDQLGRYLFEQTKRRPVILPVIMEATQRRNKK